MIVAGTRPDAIKLAPVYWWLDKIGTDYTFVWSGQHYDYEMSRIFFEQLKLPEPDIFLNVGIQTSDVATQVGMLIEKIAGHAKRIQPAAIYAFGDTNTTLATALASVYAGRPFIHDEAGMRSFDMTMLEEVNRRIADAVADLRLAPTKFAMLNLLYEGAPRTTIRLVGSTVVDAILYIISNNLAKRDIVHKLGVEPERYILVTLHRRENLTDKRLHAAVSVLKQTAQRLPDHKIVFPLHPHTRKRLIELGLEDELKTPNIITTKPLGYLEFIALLREARIVVTDSGGVQEEAFILGKRTVTLRTTTEWIETVLLGYNKLVELDNIENAVKAIVNSAEEPPLLRPELSKSPIGDGQAGRRVAKTLKEVLETGIEKRRENPFRYPMLTSHKSDATLCFTINGIPTLQGGNNHCLSRVALTPEKLKEFLEVRWTLEET